jgi:hypothetical protein
MDWKLICNADMMQHNCPVNVRDLNVRGENVRNHKDSFCPDCSYYSCVKYLFNFLILVNALGCFKCTSSNHDNAGCEDPFVNTNRPLTYYVSVGWAPRDRGGLFPSTQCIKVEVNKNNRSSLDKKSKHPMITQCTRCRKVVQNENRYNIY